MEGKLKKKLVICVILILIGIIVFIFSINTKNITETQKGFFNGFGATITILSIVLLIKNILTLKNSELLRKRQIELTDERNNEIHNKSMSTTFKICLLLQSFASIGLVYFNNIAGIYFGWFIGIELIVFCITNIVISRKM